MLYTFFLLDKPGAQAQRTEIRPEHKAYLAAKADQIAFAGPLLSDDGKSMVGSLLVIDFPSREDARGWLADEPSRAPACTPAPRSMLSRTSGRRRPDFLRCPETSGPARP
jgi:uncharacterized protein